MRIGVVGAGTVGTALAVVLQRAGHEVVGVSGRAATSVRAAEHLPGVDVLDPSVVVDRADVVLVTTPDSAVAPVVDGLSSRGAFHGGHWVGHASGILGLDALRSASEAGAGLFAMHPLQSFPTVAAAVERIPGSAFAVTAASEDGHALAEQLARDAGGVPFRLRDDARPLYHAGAVFASNYVVAVLGAAERLLRAAGVPDPAAAIAPLARASAENTAEMGAGHALTGPAARGDQATLRAHLDALSQHPRATRAYVALAIVAVDLAESAGRLDPDRAAGVREVLQSWT